MHLNQVNFSKDNICFSVMILFALVCTLKMASFSLSGGMLNPDVSLYLITALKYASMDYYNIVNPSDIFFTPIISFLTSLLFRIGLVDKSAIIIISAIFGFVSYVGLYLLFKFRFNSVLSLLGIIIYGSTSVVIFNLAKGMIDIPALSISIWILYFTIKAINQNPKYFLVVFPLFTVGFFVKYGIVGFTLPVIVVYYLMSKNIVDVFDLMIKDTELFKQKFKHYIHSNEFKYIVFSLGISLILFIIICKTLIIDFGGSLTFFEQAESTFTIPTNGGTNRIFNLDKSFYIDNFSDYLFDKQGIGIILANLLYGIIGLGILLNFINLLKKLNYLKANKRFFKIKNLDKLLIILLVILLIFTFFSFKIMEHNLISNISFCCSIILLYSILNKYPFDENLSLNLTFLTIFGVNMIFISLYTGKTFRYALPLLPPFIYMVLWSLESLFNYYKEFINNSKQFDFKLEKIFSIVLIILFLTSTFTFMLPMEFERTNTVYQEVLYCGYSNDLDDACDFIIHNDFHYHSKSFASFIHSSRIIRWNLNVNVTMLDEYDHHQVSTFNDTDYLILYKDLKLKNYNKIADFEDFHVYYHK